MMITAEHFEKAVGRPPQDDDLERSNCTKPHCLQCGWNFIQNLPVFMAIPWKDEGSDMIIYGGVFSRTNYSRQWTVGRSSNNPLWLFIKKARIEPHNSRKDFIIKRPILEELLFKCRAARVMNTNKIDNLPIPEQYLDEALKKLPRLLENPFQTFKIKDW